MGNLGTYGLPGRGAQGDHCDRSGLPRYMCDHCLTAPGVIQFPPFTARERIPCSGTCDRAIEPGETVARVQYDLVDLRFHQGCL